MASDLASAASAREMTKVSVIAESTFWPTTVPRRRDSVNVPARREVPSRLPSAPKMLPRMPMAAGMSTSIPGSCSRVSWMLPSVTPARMSTLDEMSRADKPCRAPTSS